MTTDYEHIPVPDPATLGAIHFVGIGGVGMSAIAKICVERGMTVSGSDLKDSSRLAALRAIGATVVVGHDPANVAGADTVVVTPGAIRAQNPEVVEARRRGLAIVPRAAVLASLMIDHERICVTGSHGKTTTTSMLTMVLQHADLEPSYAVGSDLGEPGTNAHHGSGRIFVAEADESDGAFLVLRCESAIITNADLDHPARYHSQAEYEAGYVEFLDRIAAGGRLTTSADDPGAGRIAAVARAKGLTVTTFGFAPEADVRIADLETSASGSTFRLVQADSTGGAGDLGQFELHVPGEHNVLDAAAAVTHAIGLGVDPDAARRGIAAFSGTRRRFELLGTARGVRVYDDYCVHHTEWGVVIRTARTVAGPGHRVIAVCQPHRYSRTAIFSDEYAANASLADEVVCMEVYPEFEDPIPGVTGSAVAAKISLPADRVHFEPSWSKVPALAASLAQPGDVIVTIGGGDVTMIGPEILAILAEEEQ